MESNRRWAVSGILGLLAMSAFAGSLGNRTDDAVGHYIVGFTTMPSGLEAGDSFLGQPITLVNDDLNFIAIDAPASALAILARQPGVSYVEEDLVLTVDYTPNDTYYSTYQYGPEDVRADEVWDTTLGNHTRNVCIVDTGIFFAHPDLDGNYVGGVNLVVPKAPPIDDHGHGTHVAGIAAAEINNSAGVAGMGNVGILAVKVLTAAGTGLTSTVATGINWCTNNNGHVISLSLGGGASATLQTAVENAWDNGMIVVAAAGNDGPCTNCVNYPAAYVDAIAVSCTTSSQAQCSFSSEGSEVDLAAPGNGILSTCIGVSTAAYCSMSGTSMSTPHVSGAAALIWTKDTTKTNAQVRDALEDNADDLGSVGVDDEFGNGLLDAKAAYDAL